LAWEILQLRPVDLREFLPFPIMKMNQMASFFKVYP